MQWQFNFKLNFACKFPSEAGEWDGWLAAAFMSEDRFSQKADEFFCNVATSWCVAFVVCVSRVGQEAEVAAENEALLQSRMGQKDAAAAEKEALLRAPTLLFGGDGEVCVDLVRDGMFC